MWGGGILEGWGTMSTYCVCGVKKVRIYNIFAWIYQNCHGSWLKNFGKKITSREDYSNLRVLGLKPVCLKYFYGKISKVRNAKNVIALIRKKVMSYIFLQKCRNLSGQLSYKSYNIYSASAWLLGWTLTW